MLALAIAPVWGIVVAPSAVALDLVTDVREWYQLNTVLWELSGIAALAGVFALGAAVIPAHPTRSGRIIATAGIGTLVIGIAFWVLALTIQGTNLLMSNAQGAVATDISYLVLTEIGHVLWLASFTTIAVGLALSGFGLRSNPAVRRWAPWVAWVTAAGLAVLVGVAHDVPPFTVFLLALPALGIAALPSRTQSTAQPTSPATGRTRP